jgi:protein-S-isoprenylcysteine O-methyltransferase Ste14
MQGIKAMKFGNIDKTDFLIPPFALFYFYLLFAAAFDWPNVSTRQFFHSEAVAWTGVLFCLAGLFILLWSLISFKQSFRIGIDTDHPDKLIVDGVFAFSRNPISGLRPILPSRQKVSLSKRFSRRAQAAKA